MASQTQSSGWISTSKASTLKSKKPDSRLHQSSLHDFIKRKPKTKRGGIQKENKEIGAVSTVVKRKQSEVVQPGAVGTLSKKQKTCSTRTRNHGLTEREAKGLGDDFTSPIIVQDSQEASWDGTTVWDSATSSRTLRDDPELSTPGTLKSVATKNGNTTWTTDNSRPFETPVLLASQDRPDKRILAPDTPSSRNDLDFDDNPFLGAPRHQKPLKPFCNMEVIPSSQSQELEELSIAGDFIRDFPGISMRTVVAHLAPSPHSSVTKDSACDHRQCSPKLEGCIPSSQSQYLLSYEASPVRSAPHNTNGGLGSSVVTSTEEVVPSSQVLGEQELKVPSSYRRRESKICLFENSNFLESSAPIFKEPALNIKNSGLCENYAPTTPQRNRTVTQEHLASASFSVKQRPVTISLSNKASSPSDIHHAPSPLLQMESLSESSMTSISPPPMASSQYSYCSDNSSYPPEVQSFLEIFNEDRHSLGSIFQDTSPSQSPAIEAPQREDNLLDHVPLSSLPYSEHRSSPESPSDLAESVSTQAIRNGHESQYTLFEESCPSVVTDFLDMLHQDRGDLGTQFRDLCDL